MAAGIPISPSAAGALGRFAVVAGAGWLLDASCLLGFSRVVPPGLANVASSLIAATFVYLVAHSFVHAGRPSLVGLRLGLYAGYTLVLILIASTALAGIAAALGPCAPGALAIICAKIVITPPQFLCNFLMSRMLARAPLGAA